MAGSAATNRPQTQSRWWPSSAKGLPDLQTDVGHRDEDRASWQILGATGLGQQERRLLVAGSVRDPDLGQGFWFVFLFLF